MIWISQESRSGVLRVRKIPRGSISRLSTDTTREHWMAGATGLSTWTKGLSQMRKYVGKLRSRGSEWIEGVSDKPRHTEGIGERRVRIKIWESPCALWNRGIKKNGFFSLTFSCLIVSDVSVAVRPDRTFGGNSIRG